jgi:hypothetical protein
MVIFLDADDALMPHCCSTIAGMWRDDIVKVQFNLQVMNNKSEDVGVRWSKRPLPSGNVLEQVLQHGDYPSMPMSGNAFRRTFLEQVMPMPAEKWRRGADVYLFIQAPFFGTILSTDQPLGCYRVHGVNSSSHVKNGRLSAQSLQTSINREKETNALIRLQANRLGRTYEDVLIRSVGHRQLLFLSARFGVKSAGPAVTSRAEKTLLEFLAVLARDDGVPPIKKLLIGIWMGAILCTPPRVAERIFIAGYRRGAVFTVPRFIAPSEKHAPPAASNYALNSAVGV